MARGVYYVASRPKSPEREAEFNAWYEEVHLPEVCSLPGFVSARRFAPVQDDGPYVALYEIEGDDLEEVIAGLIGAMREGRLTLSDCVLLDPPPEMRLLELVTSHDPEGAGRR
ncbi:DUF4286 family protein [Thermomonospora cellulosilytica]|uniref:Antibiotic biosynthesis monooxygenase (ABM) superfamily enzyme n=1 Tax=Thermomonospora cellulosilytica TaxID=1411118 RepID=A0A7W3RA29_9ACTN|nr:DUF4286 family protein [Thermomonospora cellulosilytica]MBA9005402.1 antibiotic biosynthesis monooxygenase (ABM) superfamily enzyme [Thermomonospora cellulosilytica]